VLRGALLALIGLGALAAACDREPLDIPCPPVAAGGLVVSEVRGPQSTGDDADGQWIEVRNPGAAAVPLGGLVVRLRKLDGSGELRLIVRDASLTVPAGGYAVLGRFRHGDEPAHVDYGYADDFEGDLYGSGLVDLDACGTMIDRATWQDLPAAGTLARDAAGAWCVDATTAGTPGEDNPACM
jgi:hypothetical protein